MIKVDVFVPKARDFDREMLRRARSMEAGDGDTQHRFKVASPEDVILTKLEWNSMAGGASERQWGDVQGVLKVQADALDLAYLRRWAGVLGVSEPLEQALADAGLSGPAEPPAKS